MDQFFYNKLIEILPEERVKREEPMKNHTTFRVGGPADYFVIPQTEEEVKRTVLLCRDQSVSYYIVGNGSNLLVGDKGIRGLVIEVGAQMNAVEVQGNILRAQAGVLLSQVAA